MRGVRYIPTRGLDVDSLVEFFGANRLDEQPESYLVPAGQVLVCGSTLERSQVFVQIRNQDELLKSASSEGEKIWLLMDEDAVRYLQEALVNDRKAERDRFMLEELRVNPNLRAPLLQ